MKSIGLLMLTVSVFGYRKLSTRPTRTGLFTSTSDKFDTKSKINEVEDDKNFPAWFNDSLTEVEQKDLKIIGTIPSYLNGCLIKNGPASFGDVDRTATVGREYTHVFDGLAKLSKYEFKDNKVSFSTKFLRSGLYKTIVEERKTVPPFNQAGPVKNPPYSSWEKIVALINSLKYDNVPVNVAQIGKNGPWVGVTDAPFLIAFDPTTLETEGSIKYKNTITRFGDFELFSTAHPIYNHKDGCLYNFLSALHALPIPFTSKNNMGMIVKITNQLERTVVGTVEFAPNIIPYVHDFSMTKRYIILFEYPLHSTIESMSKDSGFMKNMIWKGDEGVTTKIHVFDMYRTDGKTDPIVTYEAPPIFSYHHVNAYEDLTSNEIVVDINGYTSPDIINGDNAFAYIDNLKDFEQRKKQARDGENYRYRLPIPSSSTTTTDRSTTTSSSSSSSSSNNDIAVDSKRIFIKPMKLPFIDSNGIAYSGEMPRIDDTLKTTPFRYSYAMTAFAGTDERNNRGGYSEWALVKRDHITAEALCRTSNTKEIQNSPMKIVSAFLWRQHHCYPSEPIFIRNPNGISEDDGVLCSEVYDSDKLETFLLLLDAKTMKEMARCYIGQIRPFPFHGVYVPNK